MALTDFVKPQPVDPSNFKLGRTALVTDPRDLHALDYLVDPGELEREGHFGLSPTQVPNELHQSNYEFAWPMLANDQYGDCVIAAILHLIQAWHLHRQDTPPSFNDASALADYAAITGFDPNAGPAGNNPTDMGTDPNQALKDWKAGTPPTMGKHKPGAYAQVDYTNADLVQRVMYECGGVLLSVSLPDDWQNPVANGDVWDVPKSGPSGQAAPDPENGHEIIAVSYSLPENLIAVISWGQIFLVTYPWLGTYTVAANCAISKEQLNAKGTTDTGFDFSELQADLQAGL